MVLGYNIPGVNNLTLTRDIIVGIYNGTYTRWDDDAIIEVNPDASLPSEDILPIARADKSGTTEIFTKALSRFSSRWAQTFGSFSTGLDGNYEPYVWKPGTVAYYGRSTVGVTGTLLSLRYTIGYLSVADAIQTHIQYAYIINKAGRVVSVSSQTIQSAMDDYSDSFSDHFTADIVDGEGVSSYPLAGYTYLIIKLTSMPNCSSAVELWRYIEWLIRDTHARDASNKLYFFPLSEKVVAKVDKYVLHELVCQNRLVSELAEQQKLDELHSTQTWRKIVPVAVPVLTIVFLIFLAYIVAQQIKINRAVLRNEWKISLKRLEMFTGKLFMHRHSQRSIQSKESASRIQEYARNNVAILDGDQHVQITRINISNTKILRMRTRRGLLWLRDNIININISRFYGVCEKEGTLYCLTMYNAKGPLCNILQDDTYRLDANFQYSMACDIASGMQYLAKHNVTHGNLSSRTCYLDDKWNAKVGDWHFNQIAILEEDHLIRTKPIDEALQSDENVRARTKFWTAPEILDDPDMQPTKETDVYAFAVVLIELFSREDPFFQEELLEPKDIIKAIQNTGARPDIPNNVHEALVPIVQKAWASDPKQRPTMSKFKTMLENTKPSKKSVLDCMMESLEGYVTLLEDNVQERTIELESAIRKSTELLHRMLPPQVANTLAAGQTVAPELFDEITIFFSDIVGFTALSSESTPMEIVTMLNDLYTTFDDVVDQHEVYKVETIGEAYMVISGAPQRNGKMHAAHIASMALELAVASSSFVVRHQTHKKLEYRAGIHSGLACTGVVGIKMPRYCVFGDTVSTASRMETTSIPGKIQISQHTKEVLDQLGNFIVEPRGRLSIKVSYTRFL